MAHLPKVKKEFIERSNVRGGSGAIIVLLLSMLGFIYALITL